MPKSVSYKTKLVDIYSVTLDGLLEIKQSPGSTREDPFHWHVGEDNLDEWLGKFENMRVEISISKPYERDESHLLPENEPAPASPTGAPE